MATEGTPTLTESLPPGWDETHLEAYRDGYRDALVWASNHDEDEIQEVLDAE